MDLAFDDHRIDQPPEIVRRHEVDEGGFAGGGIDFHFADVGAGREGEVGRVVERAFLQARLHAVGQIVRGVGGERDHRQRDRLVGAGDLELAVLDDDVVLGCLELMGRDLLGLGLDLLHRLQDRGEADRGRARAIGAHAELHLVGVAMDDLHLADRNAEALGDELAEGRLMALAVAVRSRQDLDGADRIDAHFGGFPQADAGAEAADRFRRRDAAGLDVAGDADAAQLAFGLGFRLARREAGVIDRLHRGVERGIKVADVIGHDHGRLVRELRDEVLAAQFGRIDLQLPRRRLHQPFHHETCLGAARAAIGVDRHGVGVDADHLGEDVGDVVLARQQRRVEIGRHRGGEQRHVGAEIGVGLDAQAR